VKKAKRKREEMREKKRKTGRKRELCSYQENDICKRGQKSKADCTGSNNNYLSFLFFGGGEGVLHHIDCLAFDYFS
jgi:hypothetical protein